MSHDLSPDAMLQLAFVFWGFKTLLSAVELELFTESAKELFWVTSLVSAVSSTSLF
jgi:hypothetical protein